MTGHLVPLGDTGWSVWRDVVLRSTGFPADGVDRFAAPDCARAADAMLDSLDSPGGTPEPAAEETFDKEFEEAVTAGARACDELADDPQFRSAVSWQSPSSLIALDGLLRTVGGRRRNSKRRQREMIVVRYWQRYCVKNETVGFFGPAVWARIDPAAPALTASPGAEVIRDRTVELEHWALSAYAHTLAGDPAVRRWLPPALPPHYTLDLPGRRVLRPAHAPVPVGPAEATALHLCDGRRTAVSVLDELVAGGLVRTGDDGYLLLERLAERGLLTWRGDLPIAPTAEAALRSLLAGIGDDEARARASTGLERLSAARDRVADAAGDPPRLAAALAELEMEFTALTGTPARRRAGEMYAGRCLCVEETSRDVDVVLGGALLDDLAAPLALLLRAARWLTEELADAYGTTLRELYEDLAGDSADGWVGLADLWYLAQGSMFGAGERPVDVVGKEFVRRWSALFGLDGGPAGPLTFRAAELAGAAAAAFPRRTGSDRPGWSGGRLHSPDLQLCATDVDAVRRGDYLAVLGELHTAWPTFDCAVFTRWHPDQDRLRRTLADDLGGRRIRPLYPMDWPRNTGRVAHTLHGPDDPQLGFTDAPGADPDRLLPVTAVLVGPDASGELTAVAPDGRSWPLVDVFADLLATHAVDGFKLTGSVPYTPRITVDKLVVVRETWRTTVAETGLARVSGERKRYLAVRRWRRDLGLPNRVFVKLSSETKPVYVDLTSPVHAGSLCTMLGGARVTGRDTVTVSEALPDVGHHWLADAQGNRYSSELRLQVVDRAVSAGEVG